MSLTQDLLRAKDYRAANPQLEQLSDTQLADLVHKQTGELGDLSQSSALGRVIAHGSNLLGEAGQWTEDKLRGTMGESYPSRVAARAASMAVQSAPEYAINLLAAKRVPMGGVGATALGALNFGLGYGRTAVETGDTKAALGAGAGNVLSLLGSLGGAKLGSGGYNAEGAARRPIAASVGAFAGSLPGQALALSTQPGGLKGFASDSTNIPALLLSNLPYMGIDKAREVGERAKLAREKKIAETPTLDDYVDLTPEQQYIKLSKLPVSQLTEQQVAKMRTISRQLQQKREAELTPKNETDPTYDTVPESQATILAQIRMLNQGKKTAVMIPRGTKMPKLDVWNQAFMEHTNDAGTFLYDERKTSPQAIDDAFKTDTLGSILDYGVPNKSKSPTGYSAVLRDSKGVEKMAVVLGTDNEPAVMAKLNSMKEPGDVLRKELHQDVVEDRLANRNKIKDYSISYTPDAYIVNAEPGVLANTYERFFRDKHETEAGNYVQPPHWIKQVGGKEVLVNPPADFMQYLKRNKVPVTAQDLSALQSADPKGQLGFNFDYSVKQREFFKNTVLENLRKALTPTERKGARFQPDHMGNIGTTGVLKAIEQWAPKEMFEHYKAAGLEEFLTKKSEAPQHVDQYKLLSSYMKPEKVGTPEYQAAWQGVEKLKNMYGGMPPTLSGTNKVSVQALSDWIQRNTPKIEVKNLEPINSGKEQHLADQAQHRLESQGFSVARNEQDGSLEIREPAAYGGGLIEDAERLHPDYGSTTAEDIRTLLSGEGLFEDKSDAATGRYGVEPIKVSEMENPVDILVRVPHNEKFNLGQIGDYPERRDEHGVLFKGPHFGDSDKNVVASIRGYFKQLATGEKAFFPFEIQSDWGQDVAREKAARKETEMLEMLGERPTKDHPLLKSYETLALKTAIKHALENGATKIVLPDSKTAMMTEQHDKYAPKEYKTGSFDSRDLSGFLVMTKKGMSETTGKIQISKSGPGAKVRFELKNGESDTFDTGHNVRMSRNQKDYLELGNILRDYQTYGKIDQEGGMKQHYDASLPAIASRLTGDKGSLVDLGKFTNREPSEYFNGKDNITGRVYDLSNLRPEVENLFSLYGLNDQHDLTQQLASQKTEIEKALAEGREVTPEQFVEASLSGENTDNAIIVNYLKNLSGSEGPVKLLDLVGNDGLLVKGVKTINETAINAKLRGAEAIRTAAHEFSHGAMNKLQWSNPEAYADNVHFVESLGVEGRKGILQTIFDQVGIKDADTKYLSGEHFDVNDPRRADKTAREFFAGLSEALAHSAYNDARISPAVAKALSWMPVGVQRWISNLGQQWTRFFGPQYPSARHYLSGAELKNLNEAYSRMMDFTYKNESAQGSALRQLKKLELYDPSTFVNRIGDIHPEKVSGTGSGEFRDYSLDFIKNSQIGQKTKDFYEDNFLSALFRTKLYPETLDFFQEIHHYRNKIKNYEHGYLSFLGQNAEGNLSQEQAIKSYSDYISGLVSPFSTGRNERLEKMSRVFAKNQEIRESLLNPLDPDKGPVGTVTEDQLVSREQMVKDFGLSEKDADFMQRLVKLPQLVAQQTMRHAQAVDTVNLSKLFYLQNKKQDIKQVKNKVAELTHTANQIGSVIVERKFYESYMNELKKNPEQNAIILSEMESKVFSLKQQEEALRAQTEGQIRTSFANEIPFDPNPGKDSFINQVTNVSNRLAEARAEQAFIMRDEGYAPMTRRGRFLVKVFKKSPTGLPMADTTESLQGFKTKQEAQSFIKKNGLDSSSSQLIDKETFAERSQLYTPHQLQAVRDKARSDLDALVRDYIDKLPSDTDSNRDSVANALIDIRNQFRPLDQEIKEVISAKGDKFKERRWLVPGFNELDFIPNIFEYTNYKTIVAQKALTRAESELQMLRPEVQTNPAMTQRMSRELDYVLSHTDEAAGLRKLIFYSYLGGSVRHVIQNLLQVPLNGIPEMVAQGAGMHAYSHALKAGQLAHEYSKTGTTGNKTFDVLLKQAEKDGVTIPNAIEFFAPESADLQNALDSVSSYENGQTNVGEKVKYSASQLGKGLEKFMRSTAVASEQVNRRVSFIMSLLESERTGIKDPRQMFNKANVFTDYVNFVGDKSNRPGFQVKLGKTWAHAPVLVATALQSFVLNHIGQLYSYGKLAMRGDKAYQQAFATGTLHLVAMAGAMGIPFAQNAEQLFESATGISLKEAIRRNIILKANDWFDIQEKNGGRIADTVLSGFPKLAGVEASQSIGLGDPLFSYQADRSPSALDMIGPLGGIVNKAASAASTVAANPFDPSEWMNATRQVAPQSLNYWFRLMDATMKGGYYDKEGAPVVEGLNAKSSIAVAGGFTPTEVADVREVQKLRRKIETKSGDDYQNAVRLVAQHLYQFQTSGDTNDLIKANDLYDKYVTSMAGTQDRDAMVKSVASKIEEFRHPQFQPPSLKNSSQVQEALSSYPETKYPTAEKLPVVAGELTTAQLLGQQDVLSRKMSAVKSAALTSALYDHLIQAGFAPAQAALISQRSSAGLMRRLPIGVSQDSDQ